jgi:V8-like Glu-specific endopeptidase
VVLTAAHCIRGTGAGDEFAPGLHRGVSPYGRWRVTAVYLDPGWIARQDPRRDFAFLTVAPRWIRGRYQEIEQVTGGNRLGSVAIAGERVHVPAYPAGANNDPITCTGPLYLHGIYPAFNCNPYVGGTSGAPFLIRGAGDTRVVGLIGGLHQGGCDSWTSYSAPFGHPAETTYLRAASGAPGDTAPAPGSDGC